MRLLVQPLDHQLPIARCPLLGYTPPSLRVNGQEMPGGMLRVHEQIEVGEEGYDAGAHILIEFFHAELKKFNIPDLHPRGRAIIDLCLQNAEVQDYERLFSS